MQFYKNCQLKIYERCPTIEELKLQNSYFIADLNSGLAEYEENFGKFLK